MGVSQDYVIQEARIESGFIPIEAAKSFQALEHAAIHEDSLTSRFQKMAAAGDCSSGAVESHFGRHLIVLYWNF